MTKSRTVLSTSPPKQETRRTHYSVRDARCRGSFDTRVPKTYTIVGSCCISTECMSSISKKADLHQVGRFQRRAGWRLVTGYTRRNRVQRRAEISSGTAALCASRDKLTKDDATSGRGSKLAVLNAVKYASMAPCPIAKKTTALTITKVSTCARSDYGSHSQNFQNRSITELWIPLLVTILSALLAIANKMGQIAIVSKATRITGAREDIAEEALGLASSHF